jgi:hypothetical protein
VGRTLIIIGLVLVAAGLLITFGERLPVKLGRLPGDIVIRGKNGAFYFPIVTSLLLSAILTLAMWLFNRMRQTNPGQVRTAIHRAGVS